MLRALPPNVLPEFARRSSTYSAAQAARRGGRCFSLSVLLESSAAAPPGFQLQRASPEHLGQAALLRASAFYEEQALRGALPFPERFTDSFVREFAERELRSLHLRTESRVGNSCACVCLVAVDCGGVVLGCADCSWKAGPCHSDINGTGGECGGSYEHLGNGHACASLPRITSPARTDHAPCRRGQRVRHQPVAAQRRRLCARVAGC